MALRSWSMKSSAEEFTTYSAPSPFSSSTCSSLPDDVHEGQLVLEADLHQHLTEVGGRRQVDDRLLVLHPRRLDEAEGGHRVDEGRGAVLRGDVAERQAHAGVGDAVLGIGVAGHAGDALADQRLGLIAGCHHDTRTFVADREALAVAPLLGAVEGLGHVGDELAGRVLGVLQIRAAGQDGEVRRIDRRRFHLHEDLVARGLGELGLDHLDGELAVRERAEELSTGGQCAVS
jgi:hypothetical protein